MCYQPTSSVAQWYSMASLCDGSSDRNLMVVPLSYFSFQPVFHDWYKKAMVCIMLSLGWCLKKTPLLLIGKSSPYNGGKGYPLMLSE